MGPTGFVGAPEQAVVDYIRSTFVDRPKPDLIVTVAGPAAVFARKYRQQLFPDTPLLFASVDRRFLDDAPLGDNETAVAVDNQFSRTIETILQLLPETRQVFMVMGSGPTRPVLASRARERVQSISRPADICLVRRSVPSGDPAPLLRACRTTRRSSMSRSAPTRRGPRLRTSECSPSFTTRPMPPYLRRRACTSGTGVVGGSLLSIDDLSRDTADVAVRLLHGAAPTSIRRTAAAPRATDVRLARAPTVGHPREPVAARECRALSRSEPVERIQEHGAQRRRRAGRSIAPDRRTALSAPRTTTGRDSRAGRTWRSPPTPVVA